MKYLITFTLSAIISAWITYTLVTADFDRRIDRAWSDGYRTYQKDTYLPKPGTKQPDYRLKEKECG